MAPKSTPKVILWETLERLLKPSSTQVPNLHQNGAKGSQKGARSDPQNNEKSNKDTKKHTLESAPAKADEQGLPRYLPNLVKWVFARE